MNITIFCSSTDHPVVRHLVKWKKQRGNDNDISLVFRLDEITKGDLLFLISVTELVKKDIRDRFKYTLVVHASDLPKGKGWSPAIWEIVNGANTITVSLIEAVEKIDSGDVWNKMRFSLEGHELYDEINEKLFDTVLKLMDYAVDNFGTVKPVTQVGESSIYGKRTPEDSRIDPDKSISEQFNLLRVADPNRYPCFFDKNGHRYKLIITKLNDKHSET